MRSQIRVLASRSNHADTVMAAKNQVGLGVIFFKVPQNWIEKMVSHQIFVFERKIDFSFFVNLTSVVSIISIKCF